MREKLIAIGDDFTIKDERGRDVYFVDNKLLRIRDELQFQDMQGNELAVIKRKLLTLRPVYEIWRDGQQVAVVRRSFIRIIRDKFEVDVPGPDDLEIHGDFLQHEYSFRRGGEDIAHVSKRWIALTDTYGVDIREGEDEVLILASAIVIDRVSHDPQPQPRSDPPE
ncbi:MAG: LURP-one-related family protein [Chloroflexi bacterium]|nr:LURP-one-related family protein [Chloroflexota bacterium]